MAGVGLGPRRGQTYEGGFTLIEVLISTVILSALIYLAAFSYSTFLDAWERRNVLGREALDAYRTHSLLRASLESIYDYYITDPADETQKVYYPFFKGEKTGMEFVTLSSVFEKGRPALAALRLEKQNDGEGYKLLYEETPLTGSYIKHVDRLPQYLYSMTIYERVKGLTIRYYGEWGVEKANQQETAETVYRWQDAFFGKERRIIPEKIELVVDTGREKKSLLISVRGNNYYKKGFFNREI